MALSATVLLGRARQKHQHQARSWHGGASLEHSAGNGVRVVLSAGGVCCCTSQGALCDPMSYVDFVSLAIQRAQEGATYDQGNEYEKALASYTQVCVRSMGPV